MLNSVPPEVTWDAGTSTFSVSGDLAETAPLTHELDRRLAEDVVVDLTEVTFLPSTAVGALALKSREARAMGGRLQFTADAGSMAHRVLAVMALLHQD